MFKKKTYQVMWAYSKNSSIQYRLTSFIDARTKWGAARRLRKTHSLHAHIFSIRKYNWRYV